MPTSTVHLGIFYMPQILRHGTHGFTSLSKEGVLRIFPPLKIRRRRPVLNPRTWVPEASKLTPRPPKPLSTPDNYLFQNIPLVLPILNQKSRLLFWNLTFNNMRSLPCAKETSIFPYSEPKLEPTPSNPISLRPVRIVSPSTSRS
jgi:hypothetical protein